MGNVGDDPKVNQINGDNSVFIDGKRGKVKVEQKNMVHIYILLGTFIYYINIFIP